MKAKAGKPDKHGKITSYGLPTSPAEGVAGGPIENDLHEGSGLGADYEVKGSTSLPPVNKGKGGTSGAKGRAGN